MVTDNSTITGCRFMARDCNMGDRMFPSSCCTATTRAKTMRALVKPSETKAINTASAPATNAPTMGMKPAMKVRVANARAMGTPRNTRPMPMNTASTSDTIA